MYKIFAKLFFKDKKTFNLPKCHSTNDIAMEMAKAGLANHGDIVITDWQSDGKGNRGASWESIKGLNLTFSIVLSPLIPLNEGFILSMLTSLAIRKTIEHITQEKVHVKWPNDVYVNGEKIAGILIENRIKENEIFQTIVGIGLNVNQKNFQDPKATSLKNILGKEHEKKEVLELVKNHFEFWYNHLKNNRRQIKEAYLESLYKRNELSLIKDKDGRKWVRITGVDEQGGLQVEHGEGSCAYDLKELSLIK